jgi:hypothetical protein
MKQILSSIIFILIVYCNSFSQLSVGAYGGINFGNGDYRNSINKNILQIKSETRCSFSFGGYLETKIFPVLYFQSGVNFTDHRVKLSDVPLTYDGSFPFSDSYPILLSIRYTEVPLILKLRKEFDKYIPFVYSGIGMGFIYKAEDLEGKKRYPFSYSSYTKDQYSYYLFGFGMEYKMSKDVNLTFMMRYTNSLVDVAKNEKVYFEPNNFDFLLGVSTKLMDY